MAPARTVPERFVDAFIVAPARFAFANVAPAKFAPLRLAYAKLAPARFAPLRLIVERLMPLVCTNFEPIGWEAGTEPAAPLKIVHVNEPAPPVTVITSLSI